jgi:dihydrodipicolinate synthase/N-acetylneuraminate lyase
LITPLTEDYDVDGQAIGRLIRHVAGGGGNGVLVLGSTGEASFLPARLRRRVVEEAVAAAGEVDIQVLAGVVTSTIQDAIDESTLYFDAGCSAILLTPPSYGPSEPRKTETFFRSVSQGVEGPILAYHVPALTGVSVPPEVVERLASGGDVIGIKDSGRDLEFLESISAAVQDVEEFSLLTGIDTLLLPSFLLGASGAITAGTGIAPHVTAALYQAATAGRYDDARVLQDQMIALTRALRTGCFPAGFKHASSALGLANSHPMPPNPPLTEEEAASLERALTKLGLLGTEELTPTEAAR